MLPIRLIWPWGDGPSSSILSSNALAEAVPARIVVMVDIDVEMRHVVYARRMHHVSIKTLQTARVS